MKRRAIILLVCTLAGIAVGLAGDFVVADEPIKFDDVVGALALSPVAVTVGGGIVALGVSNLAAFAMLPLFVVGVLAFWPVYALLAWRCMRKGVRWMWLLLWTAQGYFMVVHRFQLRLIDPR